MTGFDVIIGELRTAGDAASGAGEQAATVDLSGAISGLPNALPGSRSASASATLAGVWGEQISNWSMEIRRHGQNLSSSADLYATNGDAAARDLSSLLLHDSGQF